MAHTPGPWQVAGNTDIWGRLVYQIYQVGADTIAGVSGHSTDARANAYLIAATPDLLEVVRRVAAWPHEDGECGVVDQARAAIRKAILGKGFCSPRQISQRR